VAELRGKAAEKAVLNEARVIERLMKNVRIAMGEELVTVVVSSTDKATGAVRTVEVQKSARDAAAANRALELLGKKLDMFKDRPAVEITAQVRRIERVIVDPAFQGNTYGTEAYFNQTPVEAALKISLRAKVGELCRKAEARLGARPFGPRREPGPRISPQPSPWDAFALALKHDSRSNCATAPTMLKTRRPIGVAWG
jgi:hypothetical protein